MDCQFKRVSVMNAVRGGTLICWELSQRFFPQGPLHFYVDVGQPATDVWMVLNREPIVDYCCFIDPCQRSWEFFPKHYYRVRLVMPSVTGAPVYLSPPQSAAANLLRKDWLIAREIVRKEHLQLRKQEGESGLLLVRKKFGVACPRCLDWDTREVTDSNCPVCYGTGINGGYYAGVRTWMKLDNQSPRKVVGGEAPRGKFADGVIQGRHVMYPAIDTKDVWVSENGDARYIVEGYSVLAQMKSTVLVVSADLKLAPATDIVYSIPLHGESSSSSSSSNAGPLEALRGLDAAYEQW